MFVKYLIDKFGVEAFKQFCLADNKRMKTKDLFKIDFDTLVNNYKSWLTQAGNGQ